MLGSQWTRDDVLHDQQAYVALIDKRPTEHTRRAGRNIDVISIAVIFIAWCDLKITDIQLIGLSLTAAHQDKLILATALVLAYWLMAYIINFFHDHQLYEARKAATLHPLAKDLEIEKHKGSKANAELIQTFEASLESFKRQEKDTLLVRVLGWIIVRTELVVALTLFTVAEVILISALV